MLLGLKPAAAYGERAPFHPNLFWVLWESCSLFFSLWISQCLVWGVRSLPCPCHCPSSQVSMAGAGMQPFPCQSLVSYMQPQPPQRGLQLARYFREKSQKQFLGTLLCSLGCSPSLSVPKTMSSLLSASLLNHRYRKQEASLRGASVLPIQPKNMLHPSGHKDLDLGCGAGGFERPVGIWERGTKPNILVCGGRLGMPWWPRQPLFPALALPGRTLTPPQMTLLAFTGSQ